jgi:hypothetical protein
MHNRHLVSPRPRALVVAAAALLVWASIAAVASAAPNKKTFSATAGPLVAGHTYAGTDTIVLTLRNTSSSAELGSANISVPAGVVATAVGFSGTGSATLVGSVIQLRNLALTPGQTATATVLAEVECGKNHSAYTWATATKQSNDFNGTGNDLTGTSPSSSFSGTCALVFSKQPKSAEKSPEIITNAIYDPEGERVTVSVVDGSGTQTVTWWSGTITLIKGDDPSAGGAAVLVGGGPTPVSSGSATFEPGIDLSATGYSLVPTASPTAGSASVGTASPGVESANFNIVDDATICEANTGCFAEAGQGQKTSAKVDASATGGAAGDLVILSINDPTVSLNCGGYTETSDEVTFDVTDSTGEGPSNRSKIATMTLLEQFVTKSASKYKVCFDNGVQAPFLLPNCDNQVPVAPCVLSKDINSNKDLVIMIVTLPGDPTAKF